MPLPGIPQAQDNYETCFESEIRWHNVCPYFPSQSKISSAEMPHLCDYSIRTTL